MTDTLPWIMAGIRVMMLLENVGDVDDDDDGKCSKYGLDELCQRLFLIFVILGQKKDTLSFQVKNTFRGRAR